jgi:hypothetical protein
MVIYCFQKKPLSFADLFSVDKRKSINQTGDFNIVFHPVAKVPQKGASIRTFTAVSEKVINPQAVLFAINQSSPFQYFEVLADGGLGHLKGFPKFAHAHGAVLQYFQNFDPVGVGQCFHDFGEFFHISS